MTEKNGSCGCGCFPMKNIEKDNSCGCGCVPAGQNAEKAADTNQTKKEDKKQNKKL